MIQEKENQKQQQSMKNPIRNEGIYSNWSGTVWDYGTDSEYPRLVNNRSTGIIGGSIGGTIGGSIGGTIGGSIGGSIGGTIIIYTAQDLSNIRNNLTGNYVLGADIDLTGINWDPIGDYIYHIIIILHLQEH